MLGGLFAANIPGGMPAIFDSLAKFIPQAWVLQIWRLALAGRPPAELAIPLTVSVLMGLAMFLLGAWLFRRRYA